MSRYTLYILLLTLASCNQHFAQESNTPLPYFVYHIAHDESRDGAFKVCNEAFVLPYYAGKKTAYKGDKPAVLAHFATYTTPKNARGETGFITIRFIVNCNGRAGRFRVEQLNTDLKSKTFMKDIPDQLLALTSKLDQWIPCHHEGKPVDSYYYLCFQLRDGELITITP